MVNTCIWTTKPIPSILIVLFNYVLYLLVLAYVSDKTGFHLILLFQAQEKDQKSLVKNGGFISLISLKKLKK